MKDPDQYMAEPTSEKEEAIKKIENAPPFVATHVGRIEIAGRTMNVGKSVEGWIVSMEQQGRRPQFLYLSNDESEVLVGIFLGNRPPVTEEKIQLIELLPVPNAKR